MTMNIDDIEPLITDFLRYNGKGNVTSANLAMVEIVRILAASIARNSSEIEVDAAFPSTTETPSPVLNLQQEEEQIVVEPVVEEELVLPTHSVSTVPVIIDDERVDQISTAIYIHVEENAVHEVHALSEVHDDAEDENSDTETKDDATIEECAVHEVSKEETVKASSVSENHMKTKTPKSKKV